MDNHLLYNINKFNYDCLKSGLKGGGLSIFDPDNITFAELSKREATKPIHIPFKELAKTIKAEPIKIDDLPSHMMKYFAKVFPPIPKPYLGQMMVNMEGIYSITRNRGVWRIEEICQELLNVPNVSDITFVIATSGIGGEIMNLSARAKHVWGYEYSPVQYGILVNNTDVHFRYMKGKPSSNYVIEDKQYANHNVELYNDDFTLNIDRHESDVMVVDPPWGGLSYKDNVDYVLKLGDYDMLEIAERGKSKLYLFKLPFNHNLKMFQNLDNFTTTYYKLKRYIIVALKRK